VARCICGGKLGWETSVARDYFRNGGWRIERDGVLRNGKRQAFTNDHGGVYGGSGSDSEELVLWVKGN